MDGIIFLPCTLLLLPPRREKNTLAPYRRCTCFYNYTIVLLVGLRRRGIWLVDVFEIVNYYFKGSLVCAVYERLEIIRCKNDCFITLPPLWSIKWLENFCDYLDNLCKLLFNMIYTLYKVYKVIQYFFYK